MAEVQTASSALMIVLMALLPLVNGHARLWEPPGRSTMWRRGFDTPTNYQDNELFCGGFAHQVQLGYKCGVCGDPYDGKRANEAGGKYATGQITRTYKQGQNVTFFVDLTANHKGYFEFKVCPTNDPQTRETQECFDRYPVLLAANSSARYSVPPGNAMRAIEVVLPKDLVCEFCVLQFRYHAGNSWGVDPDGTSCIGCGPQEEFYGCSDIRILPHGSSETPIEGPVRESSQTPSDREATVVGLSYSSANATKIANTDSFRNNDGVYNGSQDDASNTVQSPDETGIYGDNMVCRGVGGYTDLGEWCQLNCQSGYCPETHCVCEKAQYVHASKRGMGCRAAGGFANVAGYDTWCQDNCASGHCPSSLCVC